LAIAWIPCLNLVSLPFSGLALALGVAGLLVGLIGKKSGLKSPTAASVVSLLALGTFVLSYFVLVKLAPSPVADGDKLWDQGQRKEAVAKYKESAYMLWPADRKSQLFSRIIDEEAKAGHKKEAEEWISKALVFGGGNLALESPEARELYETVKNGTPGRASGPAPGKADEAVDKAVQAIEKLGGEVTRDESAPGKPVTLVNLTDKQVTDADLKVLAPLKSLKTLILDNTKVTDAGLKQVAGLRSLQVLGLSDTKVTDAGLKQLATLTSLQRLILSNTEVTDAGMKELTALKSLEALVIFDTKVTDKGKEQLRKALPKCKVNTVN